MVRKRFTIATELSKVAEEYARLDNRTFSELVCEALRQHMHRYPKARKNGPPAAEKSLIDRITALEEIVAGRVPAGTQEEDSKQMTESDGVPEAVQ